MLTQDVVKAIQAELKGQEIEASQATVKAHLNAFEAVVVRALSEGEDVKLKGFVDFTSKPVAERTAKNPQTGEDVTVPAHRKATASLAKGLRKF
jgi:DNA-binding protein HU-beta